MSLSTLNQHKNFLDIPEDISRYSSAQVAVLPVPYEATTSYGQGTALGPQAIIEASSQVEWYDDELQGEACNVGIATLEPVDFRGSSGKVAIAEMERRMAKIAGDKKFPVALGGEHSVTYGLVRGVAQTHKDFGVLQLDAHADLRNEYQNDPFSHASVMRRIRELGTPTVSVGVRSVSKEEMDYIQSESVPVFFDRVIHQEGLPVEKILKLLPERVYLTIDVDGFSPSIVPSTGTPEPGGLPWYETLAFLRRVFKEKDVIAMDVVELSPKEGMIWADFSMAKLIYKLIGYRFLQ
ncbi:MAG TPA: agmatinase [Bdellovibrionota bacterium]|nr:agmatinase [Bdellovibrionota bacterium]